MDELIDKLVTMAQLGEDYEFDYAEMEKFRVALLEKRNNEKCRRSNRNNTRSI